MKKLLCLLALLSAASLICADNIVLNEAKNIAVVGASAIAGYGLYCALDPIVDRAADATVYLASKTFRAFCNAGDITLASIYGIKNYRKAINQSFASSSPQNQMDLALADCYSKIDTMSASQHWFKLLKDFTFNALPATAIGATYMLMKYYSK